MLLYAGLAGPYTSKNKIDVAIGKPEEWILGLIERNDNIICHLDTFAYTV